MNGPAIPRSEVLHTALIRVDMVVPTGGPVIKLELRTELPFTPWKGLELNEYFAGMPLNTTDQVGTLTVHRIEWYLHRRIFVLHCGALYKHWFGQKDVKTTLAEHLPDWKIIGELADDDPRLKEEPKPVINKEEALSPPAAAAKPKKTTRKKEGKKTDV